MTQPKPRISMIDPASATGEAEIVDLTLICAFFNMFNRITDSLKMPVEIQSEVDTFPNLTLSLVQGRTLDLPHGIDSEYGVIPCYRGHW